MGKYFNINPETGTGDAKTEEISVTPTAGFTGRGPVTENLIVELQEDSDARKTVTCSRTGVKNTQSDLISSMTYQRSTSTGDTIPESGWEDLVPSVEGNEAILRISNSACWLKFSYKLNLSACDYAASYTENNGNIPRFFVRINGEYLSNNGELASVATEYTPKSGDDAGLVSTVAIENDPGKTEQMSVEVIVKLSAVSDLAVGGLVIYWADSSGVSAYDVPIEFTIAFQQASENGLFVSPASLDFETSTSEKKISVKAVSPWRAYIQNA